MDSDPGTITNLLIVWGDGRQDALDEQTKVIELRFFVRNVVT